MAFNEPIVRRLQLLSYEYMQFSKDKEARILCWRFQPDEVRMAEAFLAMEEDEQAGQTGDLFLQLQAAFNNSSAYGYSLRQELIDWYGAEKENLAELGLDTDWLPPQVGSSVQDITVLLDTLSSFLQHYAIQSRLVLVLRPKLIEQVEAYQRWLCSFSLEAPEQIRILLFDNALTPGFSTLSSKKKQRIWIQEPELDMASALEELSVAGGNLDQPGGQYRHLFVKLTNALKEQDVKTALTLGDRAVKLAAAQSWFYLAVPVHMALAGGLSNAGQHNDAVARYQAAEAAAIQGETEGLEEARTSCPQLRLQARMGCGSAFIAANEWEHAAQQFTETAPLAAKLGDARVELDCHRLASFCYEQLGEQDKAFQAGSLGLKTARKMDQETLETSTFAYLGEAIMRLCQNGTYRDLASHTEQKIIEIAGTRDWRPKQVQEVGG
ncbi:MAG: hypothetical protein ACL93V_15885 [Candidatus Electrothrix sp. YB6]